MLDLTLAGSAWLAVELLGRTPDFAPWLRTAIPVAAAIALVASPALRLQRARGLLVAGALAAAFAVGAGPASYSIASVGQSLSGNNVPRRPCERRAAWAAWAAWAAEAA